jgi:hypothetical protein
MSCWCVTSCVLNKNTFNSSLTYWNCLCVMSTLACSITPDWKLEWRFGGKTWTSRKHPRTAWEIREAF